MAKVLTNERFCHNYGSLDCPVIFQENSGNKKTAEQTLCRPQKSDNYNLTFHENYFNPKDFLLKNQAHLRAVIPCT